MTDPLTAKLDYMANQYSDLSRDEMDSAVKALARAVIQLRDALHHDATIARCDEIDAELAKALGVTP